MNLEPFRKLLDHLTEQVEAAQASADNEARLGDRANAAYWRGRVFATNEARAHLAIAIEQAARSINEVVQP